MTLPFAAILPSEAFPLASPTLQRAKGTARISLTSESGCTRLDRLFQRGSAKIRLPNVPAGEPRQIVLINTAGGMTGGDRFSFEVACGEGSVATATTQACERVYRSAGGHAEVATSLRVAGGARLNWLPQETIVFDGGRLRRRLDADLAPGATLLALEPTIFGRAAHGETVRSGLFADRWRIRRDGKLVFADDLRFDWAEAAILARPATLAGAGAMATILLVAPEPERHLDRLRAIIGAAGAASAWNGKLLARIVAEGGAALRRVLVPALIELLGGAALPKLWQT